MPPFRGATIRATHSLRLHEYGSVSREHSPRMQRAWGCGSERLEEWRETKHLFSSHPLLQQLQEERMRYLASVITIQSTFPRTCHTHLSLPTDVVHRGTVKGDMHHLLAFQGGGIDRID